MAEQAQVENEQITEAPAAEQPKSAKDMSLGELYGVVNKLDSLEEESSNKEEELLNMTAEELHKAAVSGEEEAPAESEEKQVEDNTAEAPKEEKKKTFASIEEAEEKYNNVLGILGKQGNEIGSYRSKLAEMEKQLELFKSQKPGNGQVKQGEQPTEYDPFNPESVKSFVNQNVDELFQSRYGSKIEQIENQFKTLQQKEQEAAARQKEDNYRSQALKLGEKYPDEFAVSGDMQLVLDAMVQAKSAGLNPESVHPDAPKVAKIMKMVQMVEKSGGTIKDLNHAYRVELTEGDKLDQMLLEAQKKATLNTVDKIKAKQKGAPSLSEAPGAVEPPKKHVKDMTLSETFEMLHQLPDDYGELG